MSECKSIILEMCRQDLADHQASACLVAFVCCVLAVAALLLQSGLLAIGAIIYYAFMWLLIRDWDAAKRALNALVLDR